MSDNEIERIRRDHIADPDGDPNDPHCAMCSDASYPIWPCDTAVLLAVVDSQRTIMDAQTRVSERHRKRVQELARQVAALREALAEYVEHQPFSLARLAAIEAWRAALAAAPEARDGE